MSLLSQILLYIAILVGLLLVYNLYLFIKKYLNRPRCSGVLSIFFINTITPEYRQLAVDSIKGFFKAGGVNGSMKMVVYDEDGQYSGFDLPSLFAQSSVTQQYNKKDSTNIVDMQKIVSGFLAQGIPGFWLFVTDRILKDNRSDSDTSAIGGFSVPGRFAVVSTAGSIFGASYAHSYDFTRFFQGVMYHELGHLFGAASGIGNNIDKQYRRYDGSIRDNHCTSTTCIMTQQQSKGLLHWPYSVYSIAEPKSSLKLNPHGMYCGGCKKDIQAFFNAFGEQQRKRQNVHK